MALVPFAVKLARFQAVERHYQGRQVSAYDVRRKKTSVIERIRKSDRRWLRKRKRRLNKELGALLVSVNVLLGYKQVKLSPEHLEALREGQRRYWQAKREAGLKT